MSPSTIWRPADSGETLAIFFGSMSWNPAMLIGVPRLSTIAKTLSELISLLKFCCAFGTWYW